MPARDITAAVLLIGNEILSGRIDDANLAYIAQRLAEKGIRLREARVVPDERAPLIEALTHLSARYDHVFTTGGIGPTHDDITAACVAETFGRSLERHRGIVDRLRAYYGDDRELTEARLKMADVPAGARLIDNPVSGAPGVTVENVHVLAGVPRIMRAMADAVIDQLEGGAIIYSAAITADTGESRLADGVGRVQQAYPDLEIGSYPYYRRAGDAGVSLVVRGQDAARIQACLEDLRAVIQQAGGTVREGDHAVAPPG